MKFTGDLQSVVKTGKMHVVQSRRERSYAQYTIG